MDDSSYKGLNGSGDNSGDEHHKQRSSSGSNSSEEIRKAVEECMSSASSTLDVSRKNIKHLTEEIYKLPDVKVCVLLCFNTFGLNVAQGSKGLWLCQMNGETTDS